MKQFRGAAALEGEEKKEVNGVSTFRQAYRIPCLILQGYLLS